MYCLTFYGYTECHYAECRVADKISFDVLFQKFFDKNLTKPRGTIFSRFSSHLLTKIGGEKLDKTCRPNLKAFLLMPLRLQSGKLESLSLARPLMFGVGSIKRSYKNGREPKSCLDGVFNSKLDSFDTLHSLFTAHEEPLP
jgi:hypothetical protein